MEEVRAKIQFTEAMAEKKREGKDEGLKSVDVIRVRK